MRHSDPDHFAAEGFQSAERGGSPYAATHSRIFSMMLARGQRALAPLPATCAERDMDPLRYEPGAGFWACSRSYAALIPRVNSPRPEGVEKPPSILRASPRHPQGQSAGPVTPECQRCKVGRAVAEATSTRKRTR